MAESFFSHLLKGARIVIGDDVDVKAVGSKIGQRIGGGLRSAPAGMAFVDVTGRVDADADGIVFEGIAGMERPIIPRFLVPKALATKLSRLVEGDSMEIEKQRRAGNTNIEFNEEKFNNIVASLESGMASRSSDKYPNLENRLDQYSFTPYEEEPKRSYAPAAAPRPPDDPDDPDDPGDGMRSVSFGKGGKWNGETPEPEDIRPGADLSGANLPLARLGSADLTNVDLTNANLYAAMMPGANLTNANLTNANLWGADLTDANLTGADLSGARLHLATLEGANLDGAKMPTYWKPGDNGTSGGMSSSSGGKWNGKRPEPEDIRPGADLSGADLSRMNLRGANLRGANLEGANLTDANLYRARLLKANLYDADLEDANLSDANLAYANLQGARLAGANLAGADLTEADLEDANLTEADLYHANLIRANLTDVDLTGADLSYADLSGANLTNANLTNANLTDADLTRVDPTNPRTEANLTGANLTGAKMPKGWKPGYNGTSRDGGMSSRSEPINWDEPEEDWGDGAGGSVTAWTVPEGGRYQIDRWEGGGNNPGGSIATVYDANNKQVAQSEQFRWGSDDAKKFLQDYHEGLASSNSGMSSRSGGRPLMNLDTMDPEIDDELAAKIRGLMVARDNKRLDARAQSQGIAEGNADSVIKHWRDSVDDDPDKMGDLLSSYEGDLVAAMEDHYDDYLDSFLATYENRRESGMSSFTKWEGRTPKKKDLVPGADLSGADLTRADLNGVDLKGAYLYGANLQFAQLKDADLRGANLYGANLRGANLRGANLEGAKVLDANLLKANLTDANLRGANLGFSNLGGANLTNANLIRTDLTGADLRSANLTGADLRKTNLTRSNLTDAKMPSATGPGNAIFNRANLENVDLREMDLSTADLRASNLTNADLRGVDLRGARLFGANVRGADFAGAKLPDLSETVILGADTARGMSSKKDIVSSLDLPSRDRRKLDKFILETQRTKVAQSSKLENEDAYMDLLADLMDKVEKQGIGYLDRYIAKSEEARKIKDLIDEGMSDDAIMRITGSTGGAIRNARNFGASSPGELFIAYSIRNKKADLRNRAITDMGGIDPQKAAMQIQNNVVWDLIEDGATDEEIIAEMRDRATGTDTRFEFGEKKLAEIRKRGRVKLEVGQKGTNTFAVSLQQLDEDNKNRGIAGDDDASLDDLGEALAPDDIVFGSGAEAEGAAGVAGAEDEYISRLREENKQKLDMAKKIKEALSASYEILEMRELRRSVRKGGEKIEIREIAEEKDMSEALVTKHLKLVDLIKKRIEDGSFADPEWTIPFDEIADIGRTAEGIRQLAKKYNFPEPLMSLMAGQVSGFKGRSDRRSAGASKVYQDFADQVSSLIKDGYSRENISTIIPGVNSPNALKLKIKNAIEEGLLDPELMDDEVLKAIQTIRLKGISAVSTSMVEKLRSLGVNVDNLVPKLVKMSPEDVEYNSLRSSGKSKQEIMDLMNITKEQYQRLYSRAVSRKK